MQSEVKESNQTVSVPLTSNHREAGKRGELRFIGAGACALWSISAVLLFQLAYDFSRLGFLILLYPVCLLQLTRASTVRQSFYFGLAVAMVSAAIQLNCFWKIFGFPAVALWLILAFWTALFVSLSRGCLIRFGVVVGGLLIPFLWTGLEYFRSELYYLRFSWLNIGYAVSDSSTVPLLRWFGCYGVGFLASALGVAISWCRPKTAGGSGFLLQPIFLVILVSASAFVLRQPGPSAGPEVRVVGVQLEFPIGAEVVSALNKVLREQPGAQLIILSEYTLDGEVPDKIKTWCRKNQRYLIIGGKEPAPKANFYDTAYVIGPSGDIVFRQVKSVPIQFFKDGLPAPEQKLWNSPWGRIGICVCYDLSYSRVTDRLVKLGAQALIVPTMDVMDWGLRQHELHSRVAPLRSAEYGIPIIRVASSGISQITDADGRVIASAGFPGQGEQISGQVPLRTNGGSIPWDRWLAKVACIVTAAVMGFLLVRGRHFDFG
jgi:apolipoprotein N-acyltransferase